MWTGTEIAVDTETPLSLPDFALQNVFFVSIPQSDTPIDLVGVQWFVWADLLGLRVLSEDTFILLEVIGGRRNEVVVVEVGVGCTGEILSGWRYGSVSILFNSSVKEYFS